VPFSQKSSIAQRLFFCNNMDFNAEGLRKKGYLRHGRRQLGH
jgi:hypothetical protein